MDEQTAPQAIGVADTTNSAPNIRVRAPIRAGATASSSSPNFAPPLSFVTGTWHVTHSTLPMWRKARNVAITYTPLSDDTNPKLDDKVTYQGLQGSNFKTVAGIDTPAGDGAWGWRGKGWLMIASSHWQFLGYGEGSDGVGWAVTYFQKTLFTPAGIDVYSRRKDGLSSEMLQRIKSVLNENESEEIRKHVKELFEVKRD